MKIKVPFSSTVRRPRSVYQTILCSILLLLVVEIGLMIAALAGSRLTTQLNQNAEQLLDKQVENRADYMQTVFLNAESVSELASPLNAYTEELLGEQGLSVDALCSGSEVSDEVLTWAAPRMMEFLRQKSVNGVFLLLNTQDLDSLSSASPLACVYLRDLDPVAPASVDNSDLSLQYAPASVVESVDLSTANWWTPSLLYTGKSDFFYESFQQALHGKPGLDAAEYCRWTTQPYTLAGDNHSAIAYMIPLSLPDGSVYGVIGVELLVNFLQQDYLPFTELQNDASGSYFLVNAAQNVEGEETKVQITISSSPDSSFYPSDTLALHTTRGSGVTFTNAGAEYYGRAVPLSLYSRNAPFSGEKWFLLGAAPTRQLYLFSHNMLHLLTLSVLLTLVVGSIASLLVSRRLSSPIARLSAEVEAAGHSELPELSLTGIQELDQFSAAFSARCQDVIFTSTFFMRILEMASVKIGGYELLQDSGSVFVTDSFFPLLDLPKPDPLTPDSLAQAVGKFTSQRKPLWVLPNGSVYLVSPFSSEIRYVRLQFKTEGHVQIGLAEDVTISTIERLRIEHERDYDMLTGLYNRQAFQRECETLFQSPEQLGHAALVMLDLDNLKKVNDTFGHDMGDAYIRQTGQHMAAVQPEKAVFSRMAGDEFLLFYYGCDTGECLQKELTNLQKSLTSASVDLPDGKSIPISISAGVALYPEDCQDLDTLRKYADFAMYQVKHGQKGQMHPFVAAEYAQYQYKERLHREFHQMIAEEHIPYAFQPIFNAHTGQPAAYEALMRPDYPTLHSPGLVIESAIELGEQYAIERLTLFHGTAAFQKLRQSGKISPDALLFINSIANVHLTDADMQEFNTLYGEIRPSIVVEITEEEQMTSESLRTKRRQAGPVSFALDDYGNGYSNENALLELAPRYVKMDIRIVRDIDSNPDKQQIVRNAIAYAHPRGMKIVAEGVETAAELQTVLALGVDLLQGYFLARPAAEPAPILPQAKAIIDKAHGR